MKKIIRYAAITILTIGSFTSCSTPGEEGYRVNGRRYINTDYGSVMVEGSYINQHSLRETYNAQSAVLARSGSIMTPADIEAQTKKQ